MEIKTAMAGTLESGDIFIQIAPNDNAGLHIDLDSTVAYGPGHRPSRGESHGQGSPGLHHPRPRDGSRRSRHWQRRVGRLINNSRTF